MFNKYILLVAISICSFTTLFSQSGIRVHTGLITGSSNDEVVTPDGTALYGYLIGGDARLFAEGLFFNVGLQYANMDLIGEDSPSFFGGDTSMKLIRGRIGLGLYIANINDLIRLRTRAVLDINYIQSSSGVFSDPNYRINDSHLGAALGLGADISIFTIDLEYEIGVINAYFEAEDSKISYLSLTGGVFF